MQIIKYASNAHILKRVLMDNIKCVSDAYLQKHIIKCLSNVCVEKHI